MTELAERKFRTETLRSRRSGPPLRRPEMGTNGSVIAIGDRNRTPLLKKRDVIYLPSRTVRHMSVVVDIEGDQFYFLSICTYDAPERQDPACVFDPQEITSVGKDGKLKVHNDVRSYVNYQKAEIRTQREIDEYFSRPKARREIFEMETSLFKRVVNGMHTSSRITSEFRQRFVGGHPTSMRKVPGGRILREIR